jgi:hypothetical protein
MSGGAGGLGKDAKDLVKHYFASELINVANNSKDRFFEYFTNAAKKASRSYLMKTNLRQAIAQKTRDDKYIIDQIKTKTQSIIDKYESLCDYINGPAATTAAAAAAATAAATAATTSEDEDYRVKKLMTYHIMQDPRIHKFFVNYVIKMNYPNDEAEFNMKPKKIYNKPFTKFIFEQDKNTTNGGFRKRATNKHPVMLHAQKTRRKYIQM